jgi:nitrite reductase/ring-hydroxylating ferredoxin subunit
MPADLAATLVFAGIDRDALGVAPALHLAATYAREVEAGIARVWENVFDWEHLPALHAEYFCDVRLLEQHARGWRVAVTRQPGGADRCIVIELDAGRERARYRVRIVEGDGVGTEIWTLLAARDLDRTAVEVRFYLPWEQPQRLAALGEAYRLAYTRLWDADESMMRRREILSGWTGKRLSRPVPLGRITELRQRLPLTLEIDGTPIRILALEDGEIVAHSTVCPHWRGPLDACLPQAGILRCPWHGYRFDLRTGLSADGRSYRLMPAVRINVEATTGEAMLIPV